MELPVEVTDDLQKRLRRAAGQVQAVDRMIGEGADCKDIVTQLSAATRALEQTGFRLIAAGVQHCLTEPKKAAREGMSIEELEKIFMRLS